MFTGLVEEIGVIEEINWHAKGAQFSIYSPTILSDAKIGQSLCLNGCCLTITSMGTSTWICDVVEETLNRTNMRDLKKGDRVNLERAIRSQDRLGGHFVQGHIDEIGRVYSKEIYSDHSWWVTIEAPPSLMRYLISKGSVAVDGVSLTIAGLQETSFSFAMIPHTAEMTTLGMKRIGEKVNLEIDMMAKYVERLLNPFYRKEVL